jgi:hypothetical protein
MFFFLALEGARSFSPPLLVATHFARLASRRTWGMAGRLRTPQAIAAHESPRTTKLYDRTSDEITLDEVERIAIGTLQIQALGTRHAKRQV